MIPKVRNLKQIEYDVGMPDQISLRARRLPDGEFRQGHQTGWDGPFLEFDPGGSGSEFAVGDLLEIECGPMLYLGQLQRRRGSTAIVFVEHSVDLAQLPAIEEIWG